MTWSDLFARAAKHGASESGIREALARQREERARDSDGRDRSDDE